MVETIASLILSVYKYFLLKPPLATQKINMAEERRTVDKIIIIVSIIKSYRLINRKGTMKNSAKKGRISLNLNTAGCGKRRYDLIRLKNEYSPFNKP